ncbi:hypothetical protein B0H19DRAFT_1160037 [Mycena capillaripes]|nr:hypothetical protein B0H19DRAFT_1160037 [Mycena capillaripes]
MLSGWALCALLAQVPLLPPSFFSSQDPHPQDRRLNELEQALNVIEDSNLYPSLCVLRSDFPLHIHSSRAAPRLPHMAFS